MDTVWPQVGTGTNSHCQGVFGEKCACIQHHILAMTEQLSDHINHLATRVSAADVWSASLWLELRGIVEELKVRDVVGRIPMVSTLLRAIAGASAPMTNNMEKIVEELLELQNVFSCGSSSSSDSDSGGSGTESSDPAAGNTLTVKSNVHITIRGNEIELNTFKRSVRIKYNGRGHLTIVDDDSGRQSPEGYVGGDNYSNISCMFGCALGRGATANYSGPYMPMPTPTPEPKPDNIRLTARKQTWTRSGKFIIYDMPPVTEVFATRGLVSFIDGGMSKDCLVVVSDRCTGVSVQRMAFDSLNVTASDSSVTLVEVTANRHEFAMHGGAKVAQHACTFDIMKASADGKSTCDINSLDCSSASIEFTGTGDHKIRNSKLNYCHAEVGCKCDFSSNQGNYFCLCAHDRAAVRVDRVHVTTMHLDGQGDTCVDVTDCSTNRLQCKCTGNASMSLKTIKFNDGRFTVKNTAQCTVTTTGKERGTWTTSVDSSAKFSVDNPSQ